MYGFRRDVHLPVRFLYMLLQLFKSDRADYMLDPARVFRSCFLIHTDIHQILRQQLMPFIAVSYTHLPNADVILEKEELVATSDAIILNHCKSWINLASDILADQGNVQRHLIDLSDVTQIMDTKK